MYSLVYLTNKNKNKIKRNNNIDLAVVASQWFEETVNNTTPLLSFLVLRIFRVLP